MNAVGRDHEIGLGRTAIGEGHPRDAAVLFETGATMSGMNRARGQGVGQHVDEVGAVHAKGGVPAR